MPAPFDESMVRRGQADNAGKFRSKESSAPTGSLGDTTVRVGMRTPWGKADSVQHLDEGIFTVSTPGHGGVKLSRERNARVPEALRIAGGWYEEDVEAAIPIAVFPSSFRQDDPQYEREGAVNTIRDWMPDKYEAWKGVAIAPGESFIRDEEMWRKAHREDFVVFTAQLAGSDSDMVRVRARREADGEVGDYLVHKDEYRTRFEANKGSHGFAIDEKRHARLPDATDGLATIEERERAATVLNTPDETDPAAEVGAEMRRVLNENTDTDSRDRVALRMQMIAALYDDDPGEPDQYIRDLLTDVVHEARVRGVDPHAALGSAESMAQMEDSDWSESEADDEHVQ